MKDIKFIEIKIDFPSVVPLTVCGKNDMPNLYNEEYKPSEQVLSFEPQFVRRDETSIGPGYIHP